MTDIYGPRIGVVIPSFNQADYLEEAITSVLAQRDRNVTIAVVDGGSTDASVDVIKKYSAYISYWCSEPDGGQAAAIVKGFSHIGGDIRCWLNSDDEFVEGAFRKVRKAFGRQPGLGLIYGQRLMTDAHGAVVGWTAHPPFDPYVGGYSIASETAFWTSWAEDVAGPIDPRFKFAMDADFFVRLYLAVPSLKLEDEFLGKFRCHDASKSATISHVGERELREVWQAQFGDLDSWSKEVKVSRLRMLSLLLRHPQAAALPYAKTRVRRVFSRQR